MKDDQIMYENIKCRKLYIYDNNDVCRISLTGDSGDGFSMIELFTDKERLLIQADNDRGKIQITIDAPNELSVVSISSEFCKCGMFIGKTIS